MEKINNKVHSSLKFLNYDVDNIIFEKNKEFDQEKVKMDISLKKDISFMEKESDGSEKYSVSLEINIFEDPIENNFPFSLFIKITGYFNVITKDEKMKEELINLNSVSILFPYLRSLVSTITANSNISSLIIPPLNINKLLDENKNE
ncbi:preprotein translocase subunit SecB [Halanaerobium congolense]|jgi:preprotein translocase subunit SecB|uniref:Preprotein translocase subunit SecB n=1 Tax=Halanaerobium congolense TaxID=54121 RepID=A0A318E3Z3_9FIRM|nr:protein-export chaperone SecB [Halanaerobium congolense]PXV63103.1 preprotein translocase subunit SecB [Halanaerobium congolense]